MAVISSGRDSGPRPKRAEGSKSRRGRRWLRRLLTVLVVTTLLGCVTFVVAWVLTPGVGDAAARVQAQLQSVGASDPVVATPPKVAAALVATEDSRFYSNPGIDVLVLPRAVMGAVGVSGVQAGATLEQQLAKMIYTPARSGLTVEAEQAMLAVKRDARYSKAQILQMYLAVAYFGHGFYGMSAASNGYFGLTPDQLGWGQASMLAGLVQAPSAYDPLEHYAASRLRQRHVLDRLVATGKLTVAEADAAFAAPLNLF